MTEKEIAARWKHPWIKKLKILSPQPTPCVIGGKTNLFFSNLNILFIYKTKFTKIISRELSSFLKSKKKTYEHLICFYSILTLILVTYMLNVKNIQLATHSLAFQQNKKTICKYSSLLYFLSIEIFPSNSSW